MWIKGMELGRDERKKERSNKSAHGMAAMSHLVQQFSPIRHAAPDFNPDSMEDAMKDSSKVEQQPVSIVIHNSNVQNNTHLPTAASQNRKPLPKGIYFLNELEIDLPAHALRHKLHRHIEKDLSGFNYALLKTLINANGELVPYLAIAEAAKEGTVDIMADKEVQDGKSKFTTMLKKICKFQT